ncbi:MAG TPA: copper-binding protein [Thermoanaerobaculia bacterium]|nr:copper-binding protein [Thermoanaerobaculia bacterium]
MAVLLLAAGCTAQGGGPGRDYTVRGQVRQLPDPATPGSGLYLSHEAIDDWVGRSGEVEGMDPMTMPFEVADGVSLEGIQVADVIEFTLHVDWKADVPVEITRIRELPVGTKLVFREAKPPGKS